MKHVSEEQVRKQQFTVLRDQLLDNRIFNKYRGKLGSVINPLLETLRGSRNPSEFLRLWNEFSADMSVLGNMLAKLQRDKQDLAWDELMSALVDSSHRLPEEVSAEEVVPCTVLMLQPKKTLLLCKMLTMDSPWNLDAFVLHKQQGKPYPPYWDAVHIELVEQLFHEFPHLEELVLYRRSIPGPWFPQPIQPGYDVQGAYYLDVLSKYKQSAVGWMYANCNLTLDAHYVEGCPDFGSRAKSHIGSKLGNREIEGWNFLAYFFGSTEQADVLSRFSDDEQEAIATWQFNIDSNTVPDHKVFTLGIHPAGEHAMWQQERPLFASLGISHGWGALINPPSGYAFSDINEKQLYRAVLTSLR